MNRETTVPEEAVEAALAGYLAVELSGPGSARNHASERMLGAIQAALPALRSEWEAEVEERFWADPDLRATTALSKTWVTISEALDRALSTTGDAD
jgi:hypothetical protein